MKAFFAVAGTLLVVFGMEGLIFSAYELSSTHMDTWIVVVGFVLACVCGGSFLLAHGIEPDCRDTEVLSGILTAGTIFIALAGIAVVSLPLGIAAFPLIACAMMIAAIARLKKKKRAAQAARNL